MRGGDKVWRKLRMSELNVALLLEGIVPVVSAVAAPILTLRNDPCTRSLSIGPALRSPHKCALLFRKYPLLRLAKIVRKASRDPLAMPGPRTASRHAAILRATPALLPMPSVVLTVTMRRLVVGGASSSWRTAHLRAGSVPVVGARRGPRRSPCTSPIAVPLRGPAAALGQTSAPCGVRGRAGARAAAAPRRHGDQEPKRGDAPHALAVRSHPSRCGRTRQRTRQAAFSFE